MKSNRRPRPSRPRQFRLSRLLVVGCGACGLRVLRLAAGKRRLFATTTQTSKFDEIRAAGATPLRVDLDEDRRTRRRWTALATSVIMLAPPPRAGERDPRTRRLAIQLRQRPRTIVASGRHGLRRRLVYISTSGVYGSADGRWITETEPLRPQSDRAQRRVDAEQAVRTLGRDTDWTVSILRAPGIYGRDRLPLKRIEARTPCIDAAEDGYSNHISEIDLARAALAALARGRAQRVVHASDDLPMKIGAYFDAVADAYGLPRPPRAARAEVERQLTPMQWSFLKESRRLDNRRLRKELRLVLRYPDVHAALARWPLERS